MTRPGRRSLTSMAHLAQAERGALCDLFEEVGPDAPTLCGAWTTRDLAAHLIVRERRPDAALGLVVKPLAGYGEKVRLNVAEQPWEQLVARVRSGPPLLSPMHLGAVDELTNTIEFFVHHEDVRRATSGWSPRELDAATTDALWDRLRRAARLLVRSSPMGVVFRRPSGDEIVAKRGTPTAHVAGDVAELVMFAYGRQASSVCTVEPADLDGQLRATSFGI
jgi:uncharacterized protein (TIGR03085 family)